jgi:diacylglycerol kinase family enzyme
MTSSALAGPVALIVNPAAARSGLGLRAEAVRLLAPYGLAAVHVTRGPGDARELARRAVADGAAVVAALGGDGTFGEVATALAGTPALMAPLPAGGANVFARSLGWPASPALALTRLGPALQAASTRRVVLGRIRAGVHDRDFCANAGVGLDAETVHRVEARPMLKRRLREAAFAGAAAGVAARLARDPPDLTVCADGGGAVSLVSLVVACGAPYVYVGPRPLDLLPGAAHDGALEWLGLRRLRLLELGVIMARALDGARHLGHDALAHGWAERSLEVRADRPVAVQADGEPLGWHQEVWMGPGPALAVLVPAAAPA